MRAVHQNQAHVSVYQVVEELCSGANLPAGLAGTMFSAIDCLRQNQAPLEDIRLAERISVAMHRLEWAIRAGNTAAQQALRGDLQGMGSDWLDRPICTH